MAIININGKEINTNKVLVRTTRKVKTVQDFIKEIQPNFERIIAHALKNETKPFQDYEHLKRWLVNNQEDYPRYCDELFVYFSSKVKL